MRFPAIILSVLAAMLFTSCGIDFQTKAVEKARSYALDNLRQLNETQRDFIRYTDPVIMDKVIYRIRGSNDMMHTCMVWRVPGVDGAVVVAGHGERSLLEWDPDRIVIEDLLEPDKDLVEGTSRAVTFVMARMLHLSDTERNHVRFSPPEVYATKFDIEPEETKENEKALTRWEAYLKAKEEKNQPVQYSFVWHADNDANRIVVCGFSMKKGIAGWKPKEGMKISAQEFDGMKESANMIPTWHHEDSLKKAESQATGK